MLDPSANYLEASDINIKTHTGENANTDDLWAEHLCEALIALSAIMAVLILVMAFNNLYRYVWRMKNYAITLFYVFTIMFLLFLLPTAIVVLCVELIEPERDESGQRTGFATALTQYWLLIVI